MQEGDMAVPVFRFAPSSNGELHLGHAYSALLNEKMAREAGGRLLLRIEDTDRTRCTAEFARNIIADLDWLGIEFDRPVRVQSEHMEDYLSNLQRLWADGAVYPCFCSRKQMVTHPSGRKDPDGLPHYGGTCRALPAQESASLIAAGQRHAFRIDMAQCGDAAAAIWGDVAIARPVNGSSYHIAVVTDDASQGVTHVVRGTDIEPATPIHMLLQRLLGLPTPRYHHHALIRDVGGNKLSKSLKSATLASLRAGGESATSIRRRLGFG